MRKMDRRNCGRVKPSDTQSVQAYPWRNSKKTFCKLLVRLVANRHSVTRNLSNSSPSRSYRPSLHLYTSPDQHTIIFPQKLILPFWMPVWQGTRIHYCEGRSEGSSPADILGFFNAHARGVTTQMTRDTQLCVGKFSGSRIWTGIT